MLPGLAEECSYFLAKCQVVDLTKYSTGHWKIFINKNIEQKNKDDLINNMKENYKKVDHNIMKQELFEIKPYMKNLHLSEARDKFRLRSFMTRTVKTNFSSDKKFMGDLWTCWHCPNIDSQSHIRICPAYTDLRKGKDLDNDHDLVLYFSPQTER